MSCIVGIVHRDRVFMGADSAGVSLQSMAVRADRKVFINGKCIIGFTSSFRMGNLLQYAFKPPRRHHKDVHEYMCTTFVDAVRKCFKDGGVAKKEMDTEACGNFLVGYAGRLFDIGSDYQVGESVHGYDAIGCGAQIALGSLHATFHCGMMLDPQRRIDLALEAAQEYCTGVRGPFSMASIKKDNLKAWRNMT